MKRLCIVAILVLFATAVGCSNESGAVSEREFSPGGNVVEASARDAATRPPSKANELEFSWPPSEDKIRPIGKGAGDS